MAKATANNKADKAYLADAEQTWQSFTKMMLVGVVFVAVLLSGMAMFLL